MDKTLNRSFVGEINHQHLASYLQIRFNQTATEDRAWLGNYTPSQVFVDVIIIHAVNSIMAHLIIDAWDANIRILADFVLNMVIRWSDIFDKSPLL